MEHLNGVTWNMCILEQMEHVNSVTWNVYIEAMEDLNGGTWSMSVLDRWNSKWCHVEQAQIGNMDQIETMEPISIACKFQVNLVIC